MVEEPAKYRTISKKVILEEARVERREIPAVTKTITRRIVDQEAQSYEEAIPAEYKTYTRTEPVSFDRYEWGPLFCDINLTSAKTREIQTALNNKGHNLAVDGIFGGSTSRAVDNYQKDLGLESSGVTLEALKALGVSY